VSSSPQLVRKRMGLARLGRPTRVVLTLAALALVVLACLGASTPERPLGDVRSPHRDADGRFFNPWQRYEGGGLWAYLSWVLLESSPYDRSQPAAVAIVPNDGSYLGGVEASATITWVGHATYVVHDRDDVFVTDPHFGQRTAAGQLPAQLLQGAVDAAGGNARRDQGLGRPHDHEILEGEPVFAAGTALRGEEPVVREAPHLGGRQAQQLRDVPGGVAFQRKPSVFSCQQQSNPYG